MGKEFVGKDDAFRRLMAAFHAADVHINEETFSSQPGRKRSGDGTLENAMDGLIKAHALEDATDEIKLALTKITGDAVFAATHNTIAKSASRVDCLNEVRQRMMETAAMTLVETCREKARPDAAYQLGNIMRMTGKIREQMERSDGLHAFQLSVSTKRRWTNAVERIQHAAQEVLNGLETPRLEKSLKLSTRRMTRPLRAASIKTW